VYIDNQQDGGTTAAKETRPKSFEAGKEKPGKAGSKKRAAGKFPDRSKDQNELRWFN